MKILYVKNTSDRDKKFQLQTMIYEEDGKKFVKKSALCEEAVVHLEKMKDNYKKLTDLIINPKVKLAKIIAEDEKSLIFEFIEGESLANQFNKIKDNSDEFALFIDKYLSFLKNSFKTITFDSKNINVDFKNIFGDFDYSDLDGEVCFYGMSNIDLIFSNIIHKNDEIYIIDYEWVFECAVPINYILYRLSLNSTIVLDNRYLSKIYLGMESNFIWNYVYESSFYKYKANYNKKRFNLNQIIEQKNQLIKDQNKQLEKKDYDIDYLEKLFFNREQQLQEKDLQIENLQKLVESMRIKNRIKKVLGL